jgi:hypothetical protein
MFKPTITGQQTAQQALQWTLSEFAFPYPDEALQMR